MMRAGCGTSVGASESEDFGPPVNMESDLQMVCSTGHQERIPANESLVVLEIRPAPYSQNDSYCNAGNEQIKTKVVVAA